MAKGITGAPTLNLSVPVVKRQEDVDRIRIELAPEPEASGREPIGTASLRPEVDRGQDLEDRIDFGEGCEHVDVDVDGSAGLGDVRESQSPAERVGQGRFCELTVHLEDEPDQAQRWALTASTASRTAATTQARATSVVDVGMTAG